MLLWVFHTDFIFSLTFISEDISLYMCRWATICTDRLSTKVFRSWKPISIRVSFKPNNWQWHHALKTGFLRIVSLRSSGLINRHLNSWMMHKSDVFKLQRDSNHRQECKREASLCHTKHHNTEARTIKINQLKSLYKATSNIIIWSATAQEWATETVLDKKPFSDSEIVKECMNEVLELLVERDTKGWNHTESKPETVIPPVLQFSDRVPAMSLMILWNVSPFILYHGKIGIL